MENEFNTENLGHQGQTTQSQDIGDRLKRLGQAGAEPLFELLQTNQDKANEFLQALETAIRAGQQELTKSSDPMSAIVAKQLQTSCDWLSQAKEKFGRVSSREDLVNMVEEEGSQHPVAIFVTSVIAGLLLGRVGKFTVQASQHTHQDTH